MLHWDASLPVGSIIARGHAMATSLKDILEESLFRPDERLVAALEKKLNSLEEHLLRIWLREEREAAAYAEWMRHKDRIPKGN
jgi:hypothetical protein